MCLISLVVVSNDVARVGKGTGVPCPLNYLVDLSIVELQSREHDGSKEIQITRMCK